MFVCLCWGLTSQSTIFQSCRDGATTSWVVNQYFWGVKCLAQGHNTAAVGFEPPTSRSGVRHSTTEPPRSPQNDMCDQRRLGSVCTSVQSDSLHCVLNGYLRVQGFFMRTADWSDSTDAQADLSLCWVHRSFCWFYHAPTHLVSFPLLGIPEI